eukprot:TRINITY_DN6226_c0_g1_i3.p1 TRINITY_DN6226_c0_g1~~TRINITY_DN6226_c0_g1_i3.p1  ORF type:complete len:348 (+),score=74.46 TRINITY_DN6226_c0_g1_i3:728-1771(+)
MLKAMDIMQEENFEELFMDRDPDTGLWKVWGRDDDEMSVLETSVPGYHRIISCLGWRMDTSVFDSTRAGIRIEMVHKNKYPRVNGSYESSTVKNLFFAGTLMHSLDFQKASGGFLHGFRYLIRALHRHLEEVEEEDGAAWPARVVGERVEDIELVTRAILWRVDHASGIYQVFGFLADVILLLHRGDRFWVEYREEVPVFSMDVATKRWCIAAGADRCDYVALTMEYGEGPSRKELKEWERSKLTRDPFSPHRVGETGRDSHFLHPILRYYSGQQSSDREFHLRSTLQLPEHPLTVWGPEGGGDGQDLVEEFLELVFVASQLAAKSCSAESTGRCSPLELLPWEFIG